MSAVKHAPWRKGYSEKHKAVRTVKFSVTRKKRWGHGVDDSLNKLFGKKKGSK